jgi:hypothetical protein
MRFTLHNRVHFFYNTGATSLMSRTVVKQVMGMGQTQLVLFIDKRPVRQVDLRDADLQYQYTVDRSVVFALLQYPQKLDADEDARVLLRLAVRLDPDRFAPLHRMSLFHLHGKNGSGLNNMPAVGIVANEFCAMWEETNVFPDELHQVKDLYLTQLPTPVNRDVVLAGFVLHAFNQRNTNAMHQLYKAHPTVFTACTPAMVEDALELLCGVGLWSDLEAQPWGQAVVLVLHHGITHHLQDAQHVFDFWTALLTKYRSTCPLNTAEWVGDRLVTVLGASKEAECLVEALIHTK